MAVAEAETQQLVTFYSDRPAEENEVPEMKDIPEVLTKTIGEEIKHSIITFLKRPIRMTSLSWGTGTSANTALTTIDLPNDYITNSMIKNKAEGFIGLRGTCVVRVVVNAQRFQQGRLLLVYFPQGQVNPYRQQQALRSLTLSTQLPRVELDCATSTEAILKIPYVSTTTFYNIIDETGPTGIFHLLVYSPLVAPTGSATADVAVYVHMEDIELEFPTYAVPQMDDYMPSDLAEPQMGGNTAEQESGPMSSLLGKVSTAATIVGDNVPLLSSIAGPIAWVSNVASRVASVFGWSKPINNAKPIMTRPAMMRYIGNTDAVDNSQQLCLKADNKIQNMSFGLTDIDEMSIDYLKRIPAFLYSQDWTDNDAVDVNIWYTQISPQAFSVARTVAKASGTITVYDYLPFSYIANFFTYWRGSITLNFKFVKTEFHTGRLIFWFYPGGQAAASTTELPYCYREVIDLKTSNEYSVTVPWAVPTQWLVNRDVPSATNYMSAFNGTCGLSVLSPLIAPATVSSSISIIIEACAGPDFKVAVPKANLTYLPIYEEPAIGGDDMLAPLVNPEGTVDVNDLAEPQGVGELIVEKAKTATMAEAVDPIGSSSLSGPGLAAEEFCIGEEINSLRSYLKRFCLWRSVSASQTWFSVRPSFPEPSIIVPGADPVKSGAYYDPINIFGPLFAFRRGGIRFKAIRRTGVANLYGELWYAFHRYFPSTTNFGTVSTSVPWTVADSALTSATFPGIEGGGEFNIPHYSITHSNVNYLGSDLAIANNDPRYLQMNGAIVSTSSNLDYSSGYIHLLRAMAEDTSFGFFIGVLPLTAAANVATGANSW